MELHQIRIATGAVIFRAQLPHLAHLHVIERALSLCEQVVVVLGSAWRSRNPVNPFTFDERQAMVRTMLSGEDQARVRFVGVRDLYDDNAWVAQVRAKVEPFAVAGERIALVGYQKDATSYYLQRFPDWDFIDAGSNLAVNASSLREHYFGGSTVKESRAALAPYVHPGVLDYLAKFTQCSEFKQRCAEHQAITAYKLKYPGPVYKTGDAVIEAADHVLLVRRGKTIGQDTWAFPGGFGEAGETGLQTALRECAEETALPWTEEFLLEHLQSKRVFDAPGRSPRGRIETTACHFVIPGLTASTLPQVEGRDDAKDARWWPKSALPSIMHNMFDDHDVIAEQFLMPGGTVPDVSR